MMLPTLALGAAISPYLPELPSLQQRQVALLFALADEPVMRRPLTVAQVESAMESACPRDPALCESVNAWLSRYRAPLALTTLDAQVAQAGHTSVPLANQHGLYSGDAWQLGLAGQWQPSPHVLLGAGALASPGEVIPTGTVFSAGFDTARLDIGFRDRWLSPLADSAFLQSTQAPTMPSATLSNERPVTRARIRYELFVSRMSRSDSIVDGSATVAGHPLLAGLGVSLRPAPGWSIGVARQMQYGGGTRDARAVSLAKAFFAPNHYDNFRAGRPEEFGNQQAAWSTSFVYPGARPVIVSMEFAGEDTSHGTPGRLGNAGLSLGVNLPRLTRNLGMRYEVSEWQNDWYVHQIYRDGLANRGRIIGHWGASMRAPGSGVGGSSHSLALQWALPAGRSVDLQGRVLDNRSYTAIKYRRALELSAAYATPIGRMQAGAEVMLGRDVFGERYYRISAIARRRQAGDRGDLPGSQPSSEAAIFLDVGAAMSRVTVSRDTGGVPSEVLPVHVTPHLGLGLRRAVWKSSDLGARVELDTDGQRTLLAVRALDYRYRIGPSLAVTGFMGAARMSGPIPAYGYYAGGGLQWRDARPRWDVNLDLRFGDKLARDSVDANGKLLGNDDTFHDVFSAALYLTRRF